MSDTQKNEQGIQKQCGDCGRFVLKKLWILEWAQVSRCRVRQWPLCDECKRNYEDPSYDNTM